MKLVIAQMKHETNTYSPVPTPLARFAHGSVTPPEGDDAVAAYRGTGSALAAFIELAESAGAEFVVPIAASAWPSGPVDDHAFDHIAQRICEAVAQGCDGVLLDLHGAMVTQSHDDGEGELLRRIRAIAPNVPIAAAMDMHTNLYDAFAERVNVIAGYQTYPHIDMFETGQRAGRCAAGAAAAQGQADHGLGPPADAAARDAPRQRRFAQPRAAGALHADGSAGALCATVFVGFPNADIQYAGFGRGGDRQRPGVGAALVRRVARDGVVAARQVRLQVRPLAESIAQAKAIAAQAGRQRPGGAARPQRQLRLGRHDGHDDGARRDPRRRARTRGRVRDLRPAGGAADDRGRRGRRVTLSLGGKLDMPAIGLKGQPRTVTGTVRLICDGRYRNRGPMARGEVNDMGPSAVLDTGRVKIVVISQPRGAATTWPRSTRWASPPKHNAS